MAIDREISARADAYANNPQALQKSYQQSGSVLDLIALERIKRDLEAKRQEVALQMQGNPKTVAEQTLEETKGLIQKDVTDQTSKLLAQKKRTQDARLRKLAAGQRPNAPLGIPAAAQAQRRGAPNRQLAGIGNVPPRSPVNPRGTGIAANRLSNISYGARGGIVSFANQGSVKITDAQLREMGMNRETWDSLTQGTRDIILDTYDPKHSPAYTDLRAPYIRTAALRAEADKGIDPLSRFRQIGEYVGGTEAGLTDVRDKQTAASERAGLLRDIAAGDVNQWQEDFLKTEDAPIPQTVPSPIPSQLPTGPGQGQGTEFDQPALSLEDRLLNVSSGAAPAIDTSGVDEYRKLLEGAVVPERDPMTVPTARDIDPTGYDLGADERADVRTQLKNISDQDPLVARDDAAEFAGNIMDRSGIQSRFDQMIAAQQAQQDQIEADRAKYGMYDAFGDMGHYGLASLGESFTRQRGRYREENKKLLGTQQDLMKAAIQTDTDIGKVMVEAGMVSEDSVRNSIVSALDKRNNIVTTERQEWSEQADRVHEQKMEDIKAQDRRMASIQSQIAAQVSVEAELALGAMQHQLMQEENNIKALGYLMQDRAKGEALLVEAENNVATIRADIMAMGLEAAEVNEYGIWAKMKPEERAEERKKLLEDYRLLADRNEKKFRKAIATTRSRIQNSNLAVTKQSP